MLLLAGDVNTPAWNFKKSLLYIQVDQEGEVAGCGWSKRKEYVLKLHVGKNPTSSVCKRSGGLEGPLNTVKWLSRSF